MRKLDYDGKILEINATKLWGVPKQYISAETGLIFISGVCLLEFLAVNMNIQCLELCFFNRIVSMLI